MITFISICTVIGLIGIVMGICMLIGLQDPDIGLQDPNTEGVKEGLLIGTISCAIIFCILGLVSSIVGIRSVILDTIEVPLEIMEPQDE